MIDSSFWDEVEYEDDLIQVAEETEEEDYSIEYLQDEEDNSDAASLYSSDDQEDLTLVEEEPDFILMDVSEGSSEASSLVSIDTVAALQTPIDEMGLTDILLFVILTILLSLTALHFGRSLL